VRVLNPREYTSNLEWVRSDAKLVCEARRSIIVFVTFNLQSLHVSYSSTTVLEDFAMDDAVNDWCTLQGWCCHLLNNCAHRPKCVLNKALSHFYQSWYWSTAGFNYPHLYATCVFSRHMTSTCRCYSVGLNESWWCCVLDWLTFEVQPEKYTAL